MSELLTRSLSGLLYITLLIISLYSPYAVTALFFVFGIITLSEFLKLIKLKSIVPYIVFSVFYLVFTNWELLFKNALGFKESTSIVLAITIITQLFLIKELFSEKKNSLTQAKKITLTTFYITSCFIFITLIAKYFKTYNSAILLGSFILIWVNDSFAYLVGKNFGKHKLFEKISPKKTIEGFLGGLLFACIASYFIAKFTETLSFFNWLILALIVSVFGTIGDLVESKFKRQAGVKDSGTIMPGHGGLFDRLDSIIFAAPFIYLFISILEHVS